ncbi:MAG: hypothetical protein J0H40_03215 [Rhizobiales bacterium]|nr:hypothetical protein [Hyphomicrobiales bacterium]
MFLAPMVLIGASGEPLSAPEAAGIKAALPHVDLYAPANTLNSLARL